MRRWLGMLCCLLLVFSGCSSAQETVEETQFRQYYAVEESDFYQVKGTIYQGKEDGVIFYFQPTTGGRFHLSGSMVQQQGDLQLAYLSPGGVETVLHDSRNGKSDTVEVDFTAEAGIGSVRFVGENAIFDFDLTLTGFSEDSMAYLGGKLPALHETKGSKPLTEKAEKSQQSSSFSSLPQETEGKEQIGPLPQEDQAQLLAEMEELLTFCSEERTVLTVEMEAAAEVTMQAELYAQEQAPKVPLSALFLEARMPDGAVLTVLEYDPASQKETNQQWRGRYENTITLPKGVTSFVLSPVGGEEMQVGLSIEVYE